MKSNTETTHSDAADLMITMSKFWPSPSFQKKGILDSELTRLLLNKLNVSAAELEKADQKAIQRNLDTARELEERIKRSKIDPDDLIQRMRIQPASPPSQIMEWEECDDLLVPVDGSPYRHTHRNLIGLSTAGVGDTIQIDLTPLPSYEFLFGPPNTSQYIFELPFFIACPYFLIADDGPFNDRYATLGVSIDIKIEKEYSFTSPSGITKVFGYSPGGTSINVLSQHVTNKAISDHCLFGDVIRFGSPLLEKNVLSKVTVKVNLITTVKGEGSIVEFNMSEGIGTVFSDRLRVISLCYT